VNRAGPVQSVLNPAWWLARSRRGLGRLGLSPTTLERWQAAVPALRGRAEYERGIPTELHARLLQICEPEIARLEALLGLDLAAWRAPGQGAPT
jgi:hypothetical protein